MTCKQAFSILFFAIALVGCSSGPQDVAKADIEHATDNAKVVRGIYDAAGGDYDKVSEGDKKKLAEIYKSDDAARKAFELIKNPPGGMPSGAPAAPNAPIAP